MLYMGFPAGSDGKETSAMWETRVQSLGQKNPLEKGMAPHSSNLAWRIPWTEEPGGLSPWGHKELDTTEQLTYLHTHTPTHPHTHTLYKSFLNVACCC